MHHGTGSKRSEGKLVQLNEHQQTQRNSDRSPSKPIEAQRRLAKASEGYRADPRRTRHLRRGSGSRRRPAAMSSLLFHSERGRPHNLSIDRWRCCTPPSYRLMLGSTRLNWTRVGELIASGKRGRSPPVRPSVSLGFVYLIVGWMDGWVWVFDFSLSLFLALF